MKEHLEKYMSKAQYAVMMDLWNVDELGKVNHWVSDTSINLEVAVNDPTLLQLRVLIDKQNGVVNHMYGITSTEWRVFLENSLEIPPAIALKFQTDPKLIYINVHRLLFIHCGKHEIQQYMGRQLLPSCGNFGFLKRLYTPGNLR